MAQTSQVIQADPKSLALALTALGRKVTIVEKTASSGKFLVISESPSAGQTFVAITGDPAKLAADVTALIVGGHTINFIAPTFSAAHYVVGYV
jgi:hypothetical protein